MRLTLVSLHDNVVVNFRNPQGRHGSADKAPVVNHGVIGKLNALRGGDVVVELERLDALKANLHQVRALVGLALVEHVGKERRGGELLRAHDGGIGGGKVERTALLAPYGAGGIEGVSVGIAARKRGLELRVHDGIGGQQLDHPAHIARALAHALLGFAANLARLRQGDIVDVLVFVAVLLDS